MIQRFWLFAACIVCAAAVNSSLIEAADSSSTSLHSPFAPPSRNDISAIIRQITSVRDYERLYWVLHAIRQQTGPIPAELLQELDGRIQDLLTQQMGNQKPTSLASLHRNGSKVPSGVKTPAAALLPPVTGENSPSLMTDPDQLRQLAPKVPSTPQEETR